MTWSVYALTDPRDGVPFYIGITQNPKRRGHSHKHDPQSAAHSKISQLWNDGVGFNLLIIHEYEAMDDALADEAWHVKVIPSLLNRRLQPARA